MIPIPFQGIIEAKCAKYNIPSWPWIAAIVLQESSGNPWSIRYEPGFFKRYIVKDLEELGATEAFARSTSWGLMQVMGQVAREHGFKGKFLSELCSPEAGLEYGVIHFAHFLKLYGNAFDAVSAYNQGNNRSLGGQYLNQSYVDSVTAKYKAIVGMN